MAMAGAEKTENGDRPGRALVVSRRHVAAEALASLLVSRDLDAWPSGGPSDLDRPVALVVVDTGDDQDRAKALAHEVRRCQPDAALVLVSPTLPWGSALRAEVGAAAVVPADAPGDALVGAVRVALGVPPGDAVPAVSTGPVPAPVEDDPVLEGLTERERQVLALLGDGLRAEQIASELSISPNTVRTHVQNLLGKLGATSRLEAVALARRSLIATAPPRPAEPDATATEPRDDGAVRVLLAVSHTLVREGLRALLERDGTVQVAGECRDVAEVLARVEADRPDVVVADVDLEGGGGVAACAHLKSASAAPRVIVLSDGGEEAALREAVESGADGYLAGTASAREVESCLRRVAGGEAYIPSGMLGSLLRDLIQRRRHEDEAVELFSRLSKREKGVLALLAAGLDNDAIARDLVISPHTARTHVQNVLRKLGVHSRLEAARLALDYNLVERFGATNGGAPPEEGAG